MRQTKIENRTYQVTKPMQDIAEISTRATKYISARWAEI